MWWFLLSCVISFTVDTHFNSILIVLIIRVMYTVQLCQVDTRLTMAMIGYKCVFEHFGINRLKPTLWCLQKIVVVHCCWLEIVNNNKVNVTVLSGNGEPNIYFVALCPNHLKTGWMERLCVISQPFKNITYLVIWFYVVTSDDGGSIYTDIHTDVPIWQKMLCKHNVMFNDQEILVSHQQFFKLRLWNTHLLCLE